jgi:hypothetical protein
VHPPIGGQGLNTGVQDAVNLGWNLAQVINDTSPESLLDIYPAERHPVGARVLQHTVAQTALTRTNARTDALRDTIADLLSIDEPRKRLAGMISGLDVRDDLGRDTRYSSVGCPISTWSPPTARCGCSPCCTRRGRCS